MSPSGSARRTPRRIEYKWIVATVFVCGMFIDILDTTIVNVALPDLGREFQATTSSIEWIVLGYLLSLAVWIPASGWIGDRFGTRRVFLFALAMSSGFFDAALALARVSATAKRMRRSSVCEAVSHACATASYASFGFRCARSASAIAATPSRLRGVEAVHTPIHR